MCTLWNLSLKHNLWLRSTWTCHQSVHITDIMQKKKKRKEKQQQPKKACWQIHSHIKSKAICFAPEGGTTLLPLTGRAGGPFCFVYQGPAVHLAQSGPSGTCAERKVTGVKCRKFMLFQSTINLFFLTQYCQRIGKLNMKDKN